MRHIVNTEGFKVLCTFKSNRCVGRAMRQLVKGRTIRMAVMGASRVGKGAEVRGLFLGKTAEGMHKKKSRM